jgi:hypothetical protein
MILLFIGSSCSVKNEFYYKLAIDKVNEFRWNDTVNIKVSNEKCFCRKFSFEYEMFHTALRVMKFKKKLLLKENQICPEKFKFSLSHL